MITTTKNQTTHQKSGKSMFATLAVSVGLLLSWPVAASSQEIFALSTDTGLELYQVQKIATPSWLGMTASTGSHSETATGIFVKQLSVESGLQTTPIGRLTIVHRINWEPTVETSSAESKLIAALTQDQP